MATGLDGKVALITGGARGMGASHMRALAAEGVQVVAADILDAEGEALVTELGGKARYLHLDVTDADQWSDAVSQTISELGRLDILVNNAGIVNFGTLQDHDLEAWHKIIAINLTGVFLGMRAVVAAMASGGGGSIINISSIEGFRGLPFLAGYTAAKWGVRGLTKTAALELAPQKIRVNSIHPGHVRTPMTEWIPDDMFSIPMGRAAEPSEVSSFVVFLASTDSSYATGAEFVVDGGCIAAVPTRDLMSAQFETPSDPSLHTMGFSPAADQSPA